MPEKKWLTTAIEISSVLPESIAASAAMAALRISAVEARGAYIELLIDQIVSPLVTWPF
jgi:hypothetical protein